MKGIVQSLKRRGKLRCICSKGLSFGLVWVGPGFQRPARGGFKSGWFLKNYTKKSRDCQAEVQKSVKGIILIGARADYAQSHSQCSLRSSLFFFLIPKIDSLFSPRAGPWPTHITKLRKKQSLSNEHN